MRSFFGFSSILALFSLKLVLGDVSKPSTCGPTVKTTAVTVTYEDVVTIPHSCYTQTITTSPAEGVCPTYSCPVHPDCILATTETITLPTSDPCCSPTPTTTVQAPCGTCQTGCLTETVTAFITNTTAAKLVKKQTSTSACTTTLFVDKPFTFGPTRTVFNSTVTQTFGQNCSGCALVTEAIGGLGPVVFFTTEVTATVPTTTDTYVCTDY